MDNKTKGAWIIHHARKLQSTLSQDFDAIGFAGKSGTLLSAISAEKQLQIPMRRLEALAKANHISPKTELPTILTELAHQRLILTGAGAIEVIGLTGQGVLESTARIFNESGHEKHEEIVIQVSDAASENPLTDKLELPHFHGQKRDQFSHSSVNVVAVSLIKIFSNSTGDR